VPIGGGTRAVATSACAVVQRVSLGNDDGRFAVYNFRSCYNSNNNNNNDTGGGGGSSSVGGGGSGGISNTRGGFDGGGGGGGGAHWITYPLAKRSRTPALAWARPGESVVRASRGALHVCHVDAPGGAVSAVLA